jgi:hypothetical protein
MALLAQVEHIKIFRHNPRPCRHCGHTFEHPCSYTGYSMALINPHSAGRPRCPACGTPADLPANS